MGNVQDNVAYWGMPQVEVHSLEQANWGLNLRRRNNGSQLYSIQSRAKAMSTPRREDTNEKMKGKRTHGLGSWPYGWTADSCVVAAAIHHECMNLENFYLMVSCMEELMETTASNYSSRKEGAEYYTCTLFGRIGRYQFGITSCNTTFWS